MNVRTEEGRGCVGINVLVDSVCICICVCVYIYTHTNTHINTHVHIHTHIGVKSVPDGEKASE